MSCREFLRGGRRTQSFETDYGATLQSKNTVRRRVKKKDIVFRGGRRTQEVIIASLVSSYLKQLSPGQGYKKINIKKAQKI
jgi:hypothetical protein